MANYPIEDVEGIGPAYGDKLTAAGIKDTDALLEKGRSRGGRKELAESTDISEKLILKWVNMVDLYRIDGVGSEYAELLEVAGVDTVKELRHRVPANLHATMSRVNEEKNLARKIPSESAVEKWVAQAKELPPMIEY